MRIILSDDKWYTKELVTLCNEWNLSPTQTVIKLLTEATSGDCKQYDKGNNKETARRDSNQ